MIFGCFRPTMMFNSLARNFSRKSLVARLWSTILTASSRRFESCIAFLTTANEPLPSLSPRRYPFLRNIVSKLMAPSMWAICTDRSPCEPSLNRSPFLHSVERSVFSLFDWTLTAHLTRDHTYNPQRYSIVILHYNALSSSSSHVILPLTSLLPTIGSNNPRRCFSV